MQVKQCQGHINTKPPECVDIIRLITYQAYTSYNKEK